MEYRAYYTEEEEHVTSQPTMNVKQEVMDPDPEPTPSLNLTSWHLVSTQSFHQQAKSVSQKPSLKIKIVRHPCPVDQTTSTWHKPLVKLEAPEEKPVALTMMMPKKRTPWYLLPSKVIPQPEPHTPVPRVPAYQQPFSKQRVANRPKQCWNSPHDLSGELQMKLESLKQKLVKPPKRKRPQPEQTPDAKLPTFRIVPAEQTPDGKSPALRVLPTEQATAKSPKRQLLPAEQATAANSPKRHQPLGGQTQDGKSLTLRVQSADQATAKSPNRQMPLAEQTIDLVIKQEDCNTPDDQHATIINEITHSGPTVDFLAAKQARKRAEQLFGLRDILPKNKMEGFKRPTCSKRLVKTTVKMTAMENSSTGMYFSTSFHHNPSVYVEEAVQGPTNIQPEQNLSGCFKIPTVIPLSEAKTYVSSSCNALPKNGFDVNNQDPTQPVDFTAAREARKRAEQLVKSGDIQFKAKTTGEDFKHPNCTKRMDMFEELLLKKEVSFSSLSENFQDTKRTWSNCVDNIYASFSSKADPKKTYEPNENNVNLATTIYVCASDVSRKFLLNALTKFGTITTILTNAQDAACVRFYGTNAAHCACVDMNGALAMGRIAMQVRMAETEDWASMSQLTTPRRDKPNVYHKRPPVWFEIAAGKSQTITHSDSRDLVVYTADDMIF